MHSKNWLMIACIAVVGFMIFYSGSTNWAWLILLLCPLMHLFMMNEHSHGKKEKGGCH